MNTRKHHCPFCGWNQYVKGDGTYRAHSIFGRKPCYGSGRVAGDPIDAKRAPLKRAADDAAGDLAVLERAVARAKEVIADQEPRIPEATLKAKAAADVLEAFEASLLKDGDA